MEINLTNGESLVLDEIARQANGALLLRQKKAVILAAVTMGNEKIDGDFVPLTVQYIEKSYANGKIPSGFIKREGKPSEFEILTSRLIDRSIRPLFPKNFCHPVQISIFVLSADGEDLQVLALNAASLALYISNIPINRTINAVRIGQIDDKFVINPTNRAESKIDLFISGADENIFMIEFKSKCEALSESQMLEALNLAKNHIKETSNLYANALKNHIKTPLVLADSRESCEDFGAIFNKINADFGAKIQNILASMAKSENNALLDNLKAQIAQECDFSEANTEKAIAKIKREFIRTQILEKGIRLDSRPLDAIRPISIKTNILPNAHGSALFTRGETQVLAICTIGSENDAQIVESLQDFTPKRQKFAFHYNFPSFSTGEAYPIGSIGRRELGHGNLAKRALESSLNGDSDKVIRIVAEVLESNGSSSMASVCAGSLSLYAAGLSPQFLVAGIAMGLIKEGEKYAILTDIAGLEDFEGDMDFKVAGNSQGITALQMDIKISDISLEILREALEKARIARLKILSQMEEARAQIVPNDNAPKSLIFEIPSAKIPTLIGAKGSNIKGIIERFNITIDIAKDSGKITLFGANRANLEGAKDYILDFINTDLKIGDRFEGKVKKITPFGAFIELKNGIDGLLRNARLNGRELAEGQSIAVEIIAINNDKIELDLC